MSLEKMEWVNLDEVLPNEITKFDQARLSVKKGQFSADYRISDNLNQAHVARLRTQLVHQSNYYAKSHVSSLSSCKLLKEIIGKV